MIYYYLENIMTIEEAANWFGSLYKVCKALKIKVQNATYWMKHGYIPWRQQFKITMLTNGELLTDLEDPYFVHNGINKRAHVRVKHDV